ncbi:DUF6542 domain-containing protein [Corynebacterium diphtheriae]|uniref:DUF6542 domain-containing protein n=1 Tax=Corynebacterium diphtheriae TaxID=1717 RepID=UPI0013CA22B4|nr:ABC transporter permease [Corynebacterium diphtheriae]CAB0501883.1 ABC transporter permease [Corynebacterium diphtheriae]CAB0640683.1 ABC transporter permease [Corynebacterium diphtheriae]
MQNKTEHKRHSQAHTTYANDQFFGISLWSSLVLMTAAMVTGLLISQATGSVGWPFLTIFVAFSLFTALLTLPSGLFLLVASLPLFFGVGILATAWLIVKSSAAEGTPFSTTQLITTIYPITEHFPLLAATTIGAGLIAYLRVSLLKRKYKRVTTIAERTRRAQSETDRRNYTAASKARTQAQRSSKPQRTRASSRSRRDNSVTVEELMRRRQEQQQTGAKSFAPRPTRTAAQREAAERDLTRRLVNPDPEIHRTRTFDDDLYS